MKYEEFLAGKRIVAAPAGFTIDRDSLNPQLFAFQRDIVAWALMRGRAACFADCGLGKSLIQLEWANQICRHTGGNVLILAPLAVSHQTAREGAKFGIAVTVCEDQGDVRPGINVTNYEKLHHFDPRVFDGIVLDESSILKAYDGKTRTAIIDAFGQTPYRLACTATPAPNDYMELGNHTEFLGIMSRTEMLSMFFVHDGGDTSKWRLKGHAEEQFWRWVASWAVMFRRPSDLGYDDAGFDLPPLEMHSQTVESVQTLDGALFAMEAQTLIERRQARKLSLTDRAEVAARLACSNEEPWLIWCDLNAEGDALEALIPGAVQVAGRHSDDFKEQAMLDFATGKVRVLVTKPSIAGFGMNWQHCSNVCFVGLSDSYEQFYQAIRRCWRFGQTKLVQCHVITAEAEGAVVANIRRKDADAQRMTTEMVKHMQALTQAELRAASREMDTYGAMQPMKLPEWLVWSSM